MLFWYVMYLNIVKIAHTQQVFFKLLTTVLRKCWRFLLDIQNCICTVSENHEMSSALAYFQSSGLTYYRKKTFHKPESMYCTSLLNSANVSKSIQTVITCCQSNGICFQTWLLARFLLCVGHKCGLIIVMMISSITVKAITFDLKQRGGLSRLLLFRNQTSWPQVALWTYLWIYTDCANTLMILLRWCQFLLQQNAGSSKKEALVLFIYYYCICYYF